MRISGKQIQHKGKDNPSSFDAQAIIGGKTGVLQVADKEYTIEARGMPECSQACPAGINVKAYVNLIANRRFEEAVDVIRAANPFPSVCGRVCTRPCEDVCVQGDKDDPISIRALKRFASDYELARRSLSMEPCTIIYKEKIAIIGAGPAGLSAAVDLIRLGYPVTVFERYNEPGGMLRYAIPSYRLPKEIVKREIEWIQGLGIAIKTNTTVDDPARLFKRGYSAVLIAEGAPLSMQLSIAGEDAQGVVDALSFLQEVQTSQPADVKGYRVVVIGGGSTAFDAARTARRLGAKTVTLAYRRGVEEMPADTEEIEDAKAEGITIKTLAIPLRILVKDNKVHGIEFSKANLGEPDDSGRRRPVAIKGSEFVLQADIVIPAIGARPDVDLVGAKQVTTAKGNVSVQEYGQTAVKGVFAAGDVELGPATVVEAIGRGHQAAKGIHAYLRGIDVDQIDDENPEAAIPIVLNPYDYSDCIYTPPRIPVKSRITSFQEVEGALVDFEAVEEAARCFTCGPCSFCSRCLPNCPYKQVVAETNNTLFLLKVPQDVSSYVLEKDPATVTISAKETTKMKLHNLTAQVNPELCIGCGRCEEVCSYRAIRTIVTKNTYPVAEVLHDACASCSACISVCPTGAITQGFMDDGNLLARLKHTKTPYDGVKALMSYWSHPSPTFDSYAGVVDIMSSRKISPLFLIQALARCKTGLLIIGPDEQKASHYLPPEENPLATIKHTQELLNLVGISPERIQYTIAPNGTTPSDHLKAFAHKLKTKKLKPLSIPTSSLHTTPLNEAITILRIIGATPDKTPFDALSTMSPVKPGETAYFEGCLPMLHMIGTAHHLFDLGPARHAIEQLLCRLKINIGRIEGFSCPSKGLLQTKLKGRKELVAQIKANNLKSYKKAHPKQLILGTPESYTSFSKDPDFEPILTLPDLLLQEYDKAKELSEINRTIALHTACALDHNPFYNVTVKLLQQIPGVTIIELQGTCDHTGFEQLDTGSHETALHLLARAEKLGADMVVCTSPYCEAHLLLAQREGSWSSVDIEVTDLYQLLWLSLEGGC